MINFLINLGANINALARFRWTSLHEAAFAGNVDCVKMLIAAGADVNIGDIDDTTPLGIAIREGGEDDEVAEILRAAGGRE